MAATSLNSSGKKVGLKTAKRKPSAPKPKYKCLICGMEKDETDFYKAKGSLIWGETGDRCLFCKDCLSGKFRLLKERHGERLATMMMAHYTDSYWKNSIYESVIANNTEFDYGYYMRQLNQQQWAKKSYVTSILEGEMGNEELSSNSNDDREEKWSREDKRIKKETIEFVGYDPFAGFPDADRKYLFGELSRYLDDEMADDPFKLSQVIQVVINNDQIRNLDLQIAKLDMSRDANDIKVLNTIKKDLVAASDKIAKENGISVKNRLNQDVGRSSLGYLMRDMRNKDFKEAEVNFYDMLRSPGTQWAADMSMKAILENTLFDENDRQEIFITQRELIQKLQKELDDATEENRLLKIKVKELEDE